MRAGVNQGPSSMPPEPEAGGGSALGLDPRLAKLAAIAVSFQTTYLLRRHIVFRAAAA